MKKYNNKKQNEVIDETYEIDYDMFNVEEIIKIIQFYQLMQQYKKKKVNKQTILEAYHVYKNIINNLALEKKYNDNFFKKTGISIYHEIKAIS